MRRARRSPSLLDARSSGEAGHVAVLGTIMLRVQAEQDVAAAKGFSISDAQHERRGTLRDDEPIGRGARDDCDGVGAFDLLQRDPHCVEEARGAADERAIDQVRDDLRVGVRRKPHAIRLERLSKRDVVFDDAVVNDGDFARGVRVRIVLARLAVRRPPCVRCPSSRQRVLGEPSSRCASLPAVRTTSMVRPSCTASPAESYPRYSSLRRPSTRMGVAARGPTYPTIPHM
jgi:hypothetical protein